MSDYERYRPKPQRSHWLCAKCASDIEDDPVMTMSDWFPIETAPKDGTEKVLVIDGAGGMWVASWSEPDEAWEIICGAFVHEPTHWIPLPKPPYQEEKVALNLSASTAKSAK